MRGPVTGRVPRSLLEPFVAPGMRIVYQPVAGPGLVVTGVGFDAADSVSSTVYVGDGGVGMVTVSRERANDFDTLLEGDRRSLLGLAALLTLTAGVLGYLVARALSAPFRRLAAAAAALGRGRFDLDLPDTKVPEARAIALALESSATQLRDRLEREREFGLLTSHVLRTPLTSLRLRLEELVGDPSMSPQARESALGCLKAVGQINEVAGELVEISGRGVLLAGAALPLRDLATLVAQRWSDVLEDDGRELSAAVEGDIELPFTPGPVEQVLDLLLDDVVRQQREQKEQKGRKGGVRLVFEGSASRLRVDITSRDRSGRPGPPIPPVQERAAAVVTALGGRLEETDDGSTLRVHLPRR